MLIKGLRGDPSVIRNPKNKETVLQAAKDTFEKYKDIPGALPVNRRYVK
jgi:hypothetical protein